MTNRERILNLFRAAPEHFLSGQEISRTLQISRAAVWKQVRALRELGFVIEARHAQGYRLVETPDLVFGGDLEARLKTRVIGRRILVLREVDSTNLRARQLAEDAAAEGTVVVSDRQSAGRGRRGRRWESPSGVNLYCSVLLRPTLPVQQAPQLTFLSAVAVATTLQRVCGLEAHVKWPNDVLVGRAKIAGLLNEMNAETEQIHFVILGLGINLNMTAAQFPDGLSYPVTSALLETGQRIDRSVFLEHLLGELDRLYLELLQEGFTPIRRRWENLCRMMNARIRVDEGKEAREGTVVGIDALGALRLQDDEGRVQRVLAGDIRLLGAG